MTQAATDVLGVAREQVLERGEGLNQEQVLEVLQLPARRGPATEAQSCYRVLDGAGANPIAASQTNSPQGNIEP